MYSLIKDWRGLGGNVKLLILSIVIAMAGWGLAEPFYALMMERVLGSPDLVGYLIGLSNVIALFIAFAVGELCDRLNILKLLIFGRTALLLYIFLFALAVLSGNVAFILLAFLVRGLATPIVDEGNYAYLEKKATKVNVSRIFGFNASLAAFWWTLMMVPAILLVARIELSWLLIGPLLGGLAAIGVLFLILKGGDDHFKFSRRVIRVLPSLKELKNYGARVNYAFFASFMVEFVDWVVFAFIPLMLKGMGFSFASIGLVMLVMFSPEIISILFGELADRIDRFVVIFFGALLSGAGLMLIYPVRSELLIAVLAFFTVTGLVALRPAIGGIFNTYVKKEHLGEVSGLKYAAGYLGGILGPIFVALVYELAGFKLAFFLVGAVVAVMALVSVVVAERKTRKLVHDFFIPHRYTHRRA